MDHGNLSCLFPSSLDQGTSWDQEHSPLPYLLHSRRGGEREREREGGREEVSREFIVAPSQPQRTNIAHTKTAGHKPGATLYAVEA